MKKLLLLSRHSHSTVLPDARPPACRHSGDKSHGHQHTHREYGGYCYLSYRHSFCHGWASGPTAWLSRHVLGVEVKEPGCRKLVITPHLGRLKWTEGTFPTPQGAISIRHERRPDGSIKSMVKTPKGVSCRLEKGEWMSKLYEMKKRKSTKNSYSEFAKLYNKRNPL